MSKKIITSKRPQLPPPTPSLFLIIPLYNEQDILARQAEVFACKLKSLQKKCQVNLTSKILFVDDGSRDETWTIVKNLCASDQIFCALHLSRNFGQQAALTAGLLCAKDHCEVTITLDCDGQDDLAAIDEMLAQYRAGYDIVYGVRQSRAVDSFFKRSSAVFFYKLLRLLGVETVENHADYRLTSARVLKEFANFTEVNLYLRGLFPLLGFRSGRVYYERQKRQAGHTHYPLNKMFHLAWQGITSLSIAPLRLVTSLGLVIAVFSFVGVLWSVVVQLTGRAVVGWASMTSIVCFIGGVQLVCLGIVGEYIGKIYLEVKKRPRYIVSEHLGFADEKDWT